MCRNYRRWAKSVLFFVGSEEVPSSAAFGKIGDTYVEAIYAYAKAHNIPVVRFEKGQDKRKRRIRFWRSPRKMPPSPT